MGFIEYQIVNSKSNESEVVVFSRVMNGRRSYL